MAKIKKTISGLKPNTNYIFTVKPKNTEISAVDDTTEAIRLRIPAVTSVPSDITDLVLSSNFEKVMFAFNAVNDIDFSGYEYELYDNSNGTGTPISSGTSGSNVFVISVPNSTDSETKRYWGRVRAINTSGNEGEWSALVSDAATPLLTEEYIQSLTAAKITAGTISSAEIILSGSSAVIRSNNYSAATSNTPGAGWIIAGNGSATFNDVTIRDEIHIGEDTGTSDATSMHVDNAGNLWVGANRDNIALAPFRVYNNGALIASSANISGTVTANAGNIGGWTINTSNISSGSTTLYSTGNAVFGNTTLFSNGRIINGANFVVTATGDLSASNANISGTVTANAGNIGGWTLGLNTITAGTTVLSNNGSITLGTTSIGSNGDMTLEGSLTVQAVTLSNANGTANGTVRSSNSMLLFPNGVTDRTNIASNLSSGWVLTGGNNPLILGFEAFGLGQSILSIKYDGIRTTGNVYANNIGSASGDILIAANSAAVSGSANGNISIQTASGKYTTIFGGGPLNVSTLTANDGILIIGNVADQHLAFDANEIQSKATGTTSNTLVLNKLGGSVNFGGGATLSGRVIVDYQNNPTLGGVTGSLIIGGDGTAAHLTLDNNDIQAKSNSTTGTTLQLNRLGGDIDLANGVLTTVRGFNSIIVGAAITMSGAISGVASLTTNANTAPWVLQNSDGTDMMLISQNLGVYSQSLTGGRSMMVISNNLIGYTSSTIRHKEQVENYTFNTESILNLEPVRFKYKEEYVAGGGQESQWQYGFIAEQAQEIGLNELIQIDETGQPDYFAYERLCVAQQQIIKQMWTKIEELESRLSDIEGV